MRFDFLNLNPLTRRFREVMQALGEGVLMREDVTFGPNMLVRNFPGGSLHIDAMPGRGEATVNIAIAKITILANDYLTVQKVDGAGAGGGSAIVVAKPSKLRHDAAEYPSVTTLTTVAENTVGVTDGSTEETWVVTPTYTVGDYIVIGKTSYTGVSHNGDDVKFLDLNVDGRAWAKQPEAS